MDSSARRIVACSIVFGIASGAVASESARAQTTTGRITGQVLDSTMSAPLAAALVRLPQLHREEFTHEDGGFELDAVPAGDHSVIVQRVGYRPVTRRVVVRAGEAVVLRIAMEPFVTQLAPMIVTGTVAERSRDELVSNTSALAGAELDRRLDGTLASTIEEQPGLAMTSMGPATGQPVIRGLSGDRIVVLEDGSRPGDLSSTSGDHAVAVDPTSAKRIEVVRGPMSLLYGSSALGGVVNVVRQEIPTSLPDHAHGTVTLGGASVDRAGTGSATLLSRVGAVALRAEGSIRHAEDVRTPLGLLPNTNAMMYSFAGGAGLVRAWGHGGIAYRFYDNEYGIPGGFVGGHPGGVDVLMRRHAVRGEVEWHRDARLFSGIRATGGYTDYRHFEVESSGAVGTFFGQHLATADIVARHDSSGRFGGGAIGVQARYRDIRTAGSLRTPSTDDYSLAAFAVEELLYGPLRLQGGVRFDRARYTPREQATITVSGRNVPVRPRTFNSFSGSIGGLYTLGAGVRIGGSVSRAFRTPDFNELYSNGPHLAANSFDVGDPELLAEIGIGAEGFVRVTRGDFRGEIAGFHNTMKNFIAPASRGRVERGTQGTVPRLQFTNTDAVLSGLEAEAEWSITPSVVAAATVSHVLGRFTEARDSIPVFNGTDTSFVAASGYPPLIPPLHGSASLRYERPRHFLGAHLAVAAAQRRIGDFETPTPGYAVVGLNAGMRIVGGSRLHSLTLRVDNVTDRVYRNHLSRVKEIAPEAGRSASLLYRLSF
ncbi:MAG: TonB-dependent receptor [Gemmatimonadaceae bacterium]